MTYDELMEMPETERLLTVIQMLNELSGSTAQVTRQIVIMKSPSSIEVAKKWEPAVREAIEEVSKAQKVLRRSRTQLQAKGNQWLEGQPGKGLLRAVVDTATTMSQLLVTLHGLQTEVRSVEMLGTVRSSLLGSLPMPEKRAIVDEARRLRAEDQDAG